MAGRKPLPTKIKALKGTLQKCRMRKDEPQPPPSQCEAPDELCAVGKKEWARVSKKLLEAGLLTELDERMLMLYCESYARWEDACRKLRKTGTVIKTSRGDIVQSPYVKLSESAMDRMERLMIGFGMNPSSRTRVAVAEKPKKQNPFLQIMNDE